MSRRSLWMITVLVLWAGAASGQNSMVPATDAQAFIGTWVFAMTEPKGRKRP